MKRRDRSTVEEMVRESAHERSSRPGVFGTDSSSARTPTRTRRGRDAHRAGSVPRDGTGSGGAKAGTRLNGVMLVVSCRLGRWMTKRETGCVAP